MGVYEMNLNDIYTYSYFSGVGKQLAAFRTESGLEVMQLAQKAEVKPEKSTGWKEAYAVNLTESDSGNFFVSVQSCVKRW